MKKVSVLLCLTASLAAFGARGAALTPGNVTVLWCAGVSATAGNAGAMLEYSPSGTLVQTINLASTGSPAITFGSTVALPHDISVVGRRRSGGYSGLALRLRATWKLPLRLTTTGSLPL